MQQHKNKMSPRLAVILIHLPILSLYGALFVFLRNDTALCRYKALICLGRSDIKECLKCAAEKASHACHLSVHPTPR